MLGHAGVGAVLTWGSTGSFGFANFESARAEPVGLEPSRFASADLGLLEGEMRFWDGAFPDGSASGESATPVKRLR